MIKPKMTASIFPDYNPIEKLWNNIKRNSTYMNIFKTYSQVANKVLSVMKIMREDFMRSRHKFYCSGVEIIDLRNHT